MDIIYDLQSNEYVVISYDNIHFIYIKVNASRSMDHCPKLATATHSESGYDRDSIRSMTDSIIGKVYGFDMIVIIYSIN